jgi:small GTP-binding protein
MVINVLEGPLDILRQQEVNLLVDIANALGELGETAQQDRQKLLDVAQDLRELFFLVVIIGEFNAGKSTFINALLGDELLPMGITPTTEVIELIRYQENPQRKPNLRENSIREWAHPNTGAPGVAIVDTPGTGSVFQKHETTAKSFLHRSDLVIFVISAKRAFAETERLYLEMAKNYGKKIILVLNQIDLLEPNELAQVKRFIEQQVKELLDIQPLMFTVSAKEALKNRNNPDPTGDNYGINSVRAHLRGVFNEAPPAKQKLLSQLDMAYSLVRRHHEAIQAKVNLVSTDTAKVREVQQELQQQSIGLDSQLQAARNEVDVVFEGIRQRGLNFINTNLSVRIMGRAPSKEKLQSEFQDVVIGRALRDINEASNGYVNAVVDHSRMYWRGVIDRLNKLHDLLEQEVGGLDAGVYAQQREGLQEAIRVAESELRSYSTGAIVGDLQHSFENNMNAFNASVVATFGSLVVAIAAISSLAPGGLALGPLAAPALVIAAPLAAIGGIAAYRYYQKVTGDAKNEFNQRVDRLEKTYHDALDELTRKERTRLAQYGTQVLTPVFSRLEALNKRYTEQAQALQDFLDRTTTLRKNIEAAK